MTRTVKLRFPYQGKKTTITITPAWAGKGIAIHKPIAIYNYEGQLCLEFKKIPDLWNFTHINTGLAIGSCLGRLDRAKSFAQEWDAVFAALKAGQFLAPDRLAEWKKVVVEMRTVPPRKQNRSKAHRRGREVVK